MCVLVAAQPHMPTPTLGLVPSPGCNPPPLALRPAHTCAASGPMPSTPTTKPVRLAAMRMRMLTVAAAAAAYLRVVAMTGQADEDRGGAGVRGGGRGKGEGGGGRCVSLCVEGGKWGCTTSTWREW